MQIVFALIRCKGDFLSVQHKSGISNTVSTSSDRRAKETSVNLIACKIIIPQNYICKFTFSVRYTKLYQNCTKL